MALLWFDGFDYVTNGSDVELAAMGYQISSIWGYTSYKRSGRAGIYSYQSLSNLQRNLSVNAQTLIAGAACYLDFSTYADRTILVFRDLNTEQVSVRINTSGAVTINRQSTVLGTSSSGIVSLKSWFYIEFKAYIHSTAGSASVRINGTTVLSVSNVNTRATSNNYANAVSLIAHNLAFDDFYICDNTGSINNDFLGDVRVDLKLPVANGTYSQWTPSTGSNYQNVDDNPPNGDTDYNYTATSGNRDSYDMDNISNANNILGVLHHAYLRKDDAGTRVVKLFTRIGSSNYDSSDQSVGNSYLYYTRLLETSPATGSAWTLNELNNAEFGVLLVS